MGALTRGHILIVEDNRDFAKGMSYLLKSEGFEVETVHDGGAALRALRDRAPDLVFLDLGLPDMDGIQVAHEIRNDPELKAVKIVALSGYDADMYPGCDETARFDDHLVKPVDFEALSTLLARML
jgi:CheY-like chemotaxis protein